MKSFRTQLQQYKQAIDADAAAYSTHVHATTKSQYGPYPLIVSDAFLDMLQRGGKRMRGALVMVGYEMCGGTDERMILRAATALEMVHASLLIIDDVQDRSALRRGKPTVHEMLRNYHERHHLKGDATHTGMSLALNAALTGTHAAQMLIAGLTVDAVLRSNALGIIAHAIVTTAHGQTLDFMQEITNSTTMEDVDHVMEWKTAYYSVLNPLCVGMVLAGAGCQDTDAIRNYALHTGKAFQITDDIIGVFGTDAQTGKSVMDDIREGKQTLLTVYALAHANQADQMQLRRFLSKQDLTEQEFQICRHIIETSGAKKFAEQSAADHIAKALVSLAQAPTSWQPAQVAFLRDFAQSLQKRTQ